MRPLPAAKPGDEPDCAAGDERSEHCAGGADQGDVARAAVADVMAEQGHFALVEGKVASVRESGPTIYVNFGRRRTGDITVTILKRNERSFAAAGLDLQGLAGRRVIVRGFVEARGTDGTIPLMQATRPEQIEMADQN